MALTREMLLKIKEEIQNDPKNVGYISMTNAEKLSALNNPTARTRIVNYNDQAPISRILSGLSSTPNIVEAADITAALATT